MAGLMQNPNDQGMPQAPVEEVPQEEMPPEQMQEEMPQEPMPEEQMVEDDEPEVREEDDPALQDAYRFVHQKLYDNEDFAGKLAEIFKDAGAVPQIVAQMAYKLTQSADTETGAEIAEENLVPLAVFVLEEIFEIAETVGADASNEVISKTFKAMILIYIEDQGMDSTEMKAALEGVKDSEFSTMANEFAEKEFQDE